MEYSLLKEIISSPERLVRTLDRIEEKLDLLLERNRDTIPVSEMLDVRDAARLLKVSQGSIYNWVSAGKLPYCKVNGRLLFNRQDVTELLKSKSKNKK
ncbi:dNA binding domain protein excisionase family [Porphyromonas sp. CAG:1061]|uniref:helix-turn-helix domain-containing protein n=1 Tax=Porphyromonas sp. CAG:1061 TaxID=1262916 RepID=UPI000340BD40|nr:helix-turn-helix domain-containing protein [Porphyromonas sp. CAG:1061]CCY08641.1 dNA binding domain protein excisionase family [Porphyromonas sp. CAG:1061]